MKRFLRRFLPILVAATLAGCASAPPAPLPTAPPVWRITEGKARIILFGSVHLLSERADWEKPALVAELKKARTLWFEAPTDAAGRQAASEAAAKLGLLPEGVALSSLLDPTSRERIQRLAPGLGVSPAGLEAFQPWLAEVVLSVNYIKQNGGREDQGVEAKVLALASPKAAHRAFETPEQQIGILASAPLDQQAASLAESLRQIDEEPESFGEVEQAWARGDLAKLEIEAMEPLKRAAPGVFERLVTRRNEAWAAEIERLLKSGEQAFIVVGIGHLIGPGGVPALVRARGYRVEGP